MPVQTREQLLTLLQTSLRTTGQSIQDRVNTLLHRFATQDSLPMRELAGIRERVFADIETVTQLPLKATLTNTGVGLEARLRVLAEALAETGNASLRHTLPVPSTDLIVGASLLSPELKEALVQLNQRGCLCRRR